MKKIAVLGGGTGTFVVLSSLKKYPLDLGVIVTMMDSGDSTGRLRDQLGVLPPGDLRQCLVALSESSEIWRKLFLYRFETGDLKGHNFGNIFLAALEKVSDSYTQVVDLASVVLKTKGEVIPVTYEKTHLGVKYESGAVIEREGNIDEDNEETSRIVEAYLKPPVPSNEKAIKRLLYSDYIIVGPGDIYTSLVPVLLADGIKDTIKKSKAKLILILNLMTKHGQTTNYSASNYVEDIQRYSGRLPDFVIVNTQPIPTDMLKWYEDHKENLVENDLKQSNYKGKVILGDLLDETKVITSSADKLNRSVLRHSSEKLAKLLMEKVIK